MHVFDHRGSRTRGLIYRKCKESVNSNSFIHASITIFTSVKVYIFVNNGYKGDPQKGFCNRRFYAGHPIIWCDVSGMLHMPQGRYRDGC